MLTVKFSQRHRHRLATQKGFPAIPPAGAPSDPSRIVTKVSLGENGPATYIDHYD